MLVIGLTGSIAMGKSEAARYFASLDFPVFDSDAEVHKLYDSAAGAALIAPYAPEAINNNKVDRAKLSALVTQTPALLSQLEKLVHAEIRMRREVFLTAAKQAGAKAAILDIPLLYETGAEKDMDKVIVISSSPEIQHQRALARPGMTEERFKLIRARQLPDDQKRKLADVVVDNSSTIQQMQKHLHETVHKWGLIDHA